MTTNREKKKEPGKILLEPIASKVEIAQLWHLSKGWDYAMGNESESLNLGST